MTEEKEKELEKILTKLESGSLRLSEATKLYERGAELIEEFSKELQEAKGKILVVRKKLDKIILEDLPSDI